MKKKKIIGLTILSCGFFIPYIISLIKEKFSLSQYCGSRYFFTIAMPIIIAGFVLLTSEKKQIKLDIFGKILLSILFVIWFTMSILLLF
ncbi:MAG: hypothetical protein JSV30_03360 [Candidatus Omnitrophota bacterium]|nr:MAG: hypothetical protein JSV30_03360 [Candidatus Omnitrophota bacterium]